MKMVLWPASESLSASDSALKSSCASLAALCSVLDTERSNNSYPYTLRDSSRMACRAMARLAPEEDGVSGLGMVATGMLGTQRY